MENLKKINWQSPSNIAIVKYWGKYPSQIPMNPSLSFTLNKCYTETSIEYNTKGTGQINFFYKDEINEPFGIKVKKFIHSLNLSFLQNLDLNINSYNTFPHSAGIASSASAMSALALCLTSLEDLMQNEKRDICEFKTRASYIARLGSGSASRSIFPKASIWGKVETVPFSSDLFGIDWSKQLGSDFQAIQDWIFLVSSSEKSVSSSHGHQLMENHVFRNSRIEQANENILKIIQATKNNDWELFIDVCEEEALTLHGLMMSSRPYYILLAPDSLKIIQSIKQFRIEQKIPVTFTIDAGPNIHMLFDRKYEKQVQEFCESEWSEYLMQGKILKDHMGEGPIQIA